jgi:hypothetical protein
MSLPGAAIGGIARMRCPWRAIIRVDALGRHALVGCFSSLSNVSGIVQAWLWHTWRRRHGQRLDEWCRHEAASAGGSGSLTVEVNRMREMKQTGGHVLPVMGVLVISVLRVHQRD